MNPISLELSVRFKVTGKTVPRWSNRNKINYIKRDGDIRETEAFVVHKLRKIRISLSLG